MTQVSGPGALPPTLPLPLLPPPAYEDHHLTEYVPVSVLPPNPFSSAGPAIAPRPARPSCTCNAAAAAAPAVGDNISTPRSSDEDCHSSRPPSKESELRPANRGSGASVGVVDNALSASAPPVYARQDPDIRAYSIRAPFISSSIPSIPSPSRMSSSSSSASTAPSCVYTPRFQLAQTLSSIGKPYKLRIRRLTTSESRRVSLAWPTTPSQTREEESSPPQQKQRLKQQRIDFDDDLTVYEASNTNALQKWGNSLSLEIRGCKARSLRGHIEMAGVSRRTGTCKFWHMIRSDAAAAKGRERMSKWGYRPEDEWTKRLLFSVGPGPATTRLGKDRWSASRRSSMGSLSGTGSPGSMSWRDGETGRELAVEVDGELEFVDGVDQKTREALLACCACRLWALGLLTWS